MTSDIVGGTLANAAADARVDLLSLALRVPGWMSEAVCSTTDPALYFPGPGRPDDLAAAKAVCSGCPVRLKCLEHALENDERFGIYGGLTAAERQQLVKGMQESIPPAYAEYVGRQIIEQLQLRVA